MNKLWTPEQMELASEASSGPLVVADGRLQVDAAERTATVDGQLVERMWPKEFDILATLAERPDGLVTYPELSDRVWGDPNFYYMSNSPAIMMSGLRKKLGKELGDRTQGAIRTRRGLGFTAVSSLEGPSLPETCGGETAEPLSFADGRIEIHTDEQLVVCDGEIATGMTPRHLTILTYLAGKVDRIAGFAELGIRGWGESTKFARQGTMVAISEVRQNLGLELGDIHDGAIRTVHGVGYSAVSTLTAPAV